MSQTAPPPPDISPFGTYAPTPFQRALMAIGRGAGHGYLGQRLGTAMRSAMRRSAGSKPLDVVVLGQRMRLHLHDNAADRRLAATPQFFDPEEIAELRRLRRPDLQFVDLGANVGTYSLIAAQLAGTHEGARILAIEPNPDTVARLTVNIALNGFKVMIAPVAAGDAEGELELKIDERNLGATSLHDVYKGSGVPKRRAVRIRLLHDIVAEAGFERIDALKADIEGFEDRALLPFFRSAPERLWPGLMIIENSLDRWGANLLEELAARGYSYALQKKNIILRRSAG